jgi:hypothetical protein
MASAQLDWILGKNPFAITSMYGFGKTNYPQYPSSKPKPNIKGGICNGITAKDGNENDIAWKPNPDSDWQNWRWIEQWLPHNAWYLIAISSLSHRMDNPILPDAIKKSTIANIPSFNILAVNARNIMIELPFASRNSVISIYNMQGQKLGSHSIPAGNLSATVELPSNMKSGVYLLKLDGSARKFVYGNR